MSKILCKEPLRHFVRRNVMRFIFSGRPWGNSVAPSVNACFIALLLLSVSFANAQPSAFTYQGRLASGGAPSTGRFDLAFAVYSAATGGTQLGSPVTNFNAGVTNGLFTAVLDFGAEVFSGPDRWLEIAVRTNGAAAFTTLSPRQRITAAPYAVSAARLSGRVTSENVSGSYGDAVTFSHPANSFAGNGAGLTGLNASQLTAGLVPDERHSTNIARTAQVWLRGGNAGTSAVSDFLGTTDSEPLELRVNGLRALRMEAGSNWTVNVIGGSYANYVGPGVIGATVFGGGGVGLSRVLGNYGAIAGGLQNAVEEVATAGFIGGGQRNRVGSNAVASVVGGGEQNVIAANSTHAAIVGGSFNEIQAGAVAAVIGGGLQNQIGRAHQAVIGGGYNNSIASNASAAAIVGGVGNEVGPNNGYGAIGGGLDNRVTGSAATVPGGAFNRADGAFSFAAGFRAAALHGGSFVWSDGGDWPSTAPNQFLIRASGGVGIGTTNVAAQLDVSTGGGDSFPQVRINQTNLANFARLRFTVGTNYAKRWDLAATTNRFVIYSGHYDSEMISLDSAGLTVRGTFVSSSDRNLKTNLVPVDAEAILERVASLPLATWSYIHDPDTRHLGPMAQDFREAFGLGRDEKHIAAVDADGVALAAIQALNARLEETRSELRLVASENAALRELLERVERKLGASDQARE
jgi:trimeric autotransporter adhesin